MKTAWKHLDTGINDSFKNMAIDDALVRCMEDTDQPIIRFYDWSAPCISIGFSQRAGNVLKLDLCKKHNIPVVRRPTGGGVVFHGVDFTYSVILPKKHHLLIQDTFIWIHKKIGNCLARIGVKTDIFPKKENKPKGFCYVSPNIGDLICKNKKLGGIAGRKIKGKILCQGYLYLSDASEMLKYSRGMGTLGKAISVRNVLKKDLDRMTIINAILNNWDTEVDNYIMKTKEEETADILYQTKYTQREWNFRR